MLVLEFLRILLYAQSDIARARRLAYAARGGPGRLDWRRPVPSHLDIGLKHGEVALASAHALGEAVLLEKAE